MGDYAIILLAAGGSTRLGEPKQLLEHQGKTLLQHALEAALATSVKPVLVVIGAHASQVTGSIPGIEGVSLVINDHWEEGLASSIRNGISFLQKTGFNGKAAILMVCDQPFVTADLLGQLITIYETTGQPIVASHYNGTMGTPALFDRSIFASLVQLQGDVGAKKIMLENKQQVALVDFDKGNVDIDTAQDYHSLLQHAKNGR